MARILVVDDEPGLRQVLTALLSVQGHEVVSAEDGNKALELITSKEFELMLSDIRMRPMDGMQLLKKVREVRPMVAVIMLTAFSSIETAIESLKLGAFDYLTKPFKVDELIDTIRRGLDYHKALAEKTDDTKHPAVKYELGNIVADSPAMKEVCEMIKRVAPIDTPVLIHGESGTMKKTIAEAIHKQSKRQHMRFLALNCAVLPEPLLDAELFGYVKGAFPGAQADKDGFFESAKGGSVLLQEIESMPPSIQDKLLKILQERTVRRIGGNKDATVDVRLLVSSNLPPSSLIGPDRIREELFSRISVIPIEIPPLRERAEDILPLVYDALKRLSPAGTEPPDIDPEARELLQAYPWPGNQREMENAAKHALESLSNGKIAKVSLPEKIAATPLAVKQGSASDNLDASRGKALRQFLTVKGKGMAEQVKRAVKSNMK